MVKEEEEEMSEEKDNGMETSFSRQSEPA